MSSADVKTLGGLLEWHPTEASALVAAAALGERGAVEMRRGGDPVPLTGTSAEVWLHESPVIDAFPLARAGTRTLAEAREVIASLALDEIAYEGAKASRADQANAQGSADVDPLAEAAEHGATHMTRRRMAELGREPADSTPNRLVAGVVRIGGLSP